MTYFVIADDGAEFGPADIELLAEWAKENRLRPDSRLRDAVTSEILVAGSVPGIFPDKPYEDIQFSQNDGVKEMADGGIYIPKEALHMMRESSEKRLFFWNAGWIALAVVLAIWLRGSGLFIMAFATYDTYRLVSARSRYANASIAITVIAWIIVGASFMGVFGDR